MTRVLVAIAAFLSARIAVGGSGPACRTCHPKETARYLASAMGNSVGRPVLLPSGQVVHPASHSQINVETGNGAMVHRLTEHGLTAAYTVAVQVGAGVYGSSYLVRIGRSLIQSPVSYFKRAGWDISPGFESSDLLDFNRTVGDACLFCHSNASDTSDFGILKWPGSAV